MPGMVNRPSARVVAVYVVPDGPCTATTRAPSSRTPLESVTVPVIAAVVTPWASILLVTAENAAAAASAYDKRTIQRMVGSLLRNTGTWQGERSSSQRSKLVRGREPVKNAATSALYATDTRTRHPP